jgi:hypothetical protein
MTGVAITDGAVGWILDVPTGITGLDRLHAFQLVKNCLQTPEASPSQCGGLKMIVHYEFSFS